MNIEDKKARLANTISKKIGIAVEMTVRGDRSFTFSTDDVTPNLGKKVKEFFGDKANVKTEHEEDVGSFAYVELKSAA